MIWWLFPCIFCDLFSNGHLSCKIPTSISPYFFSRFPHAHFSEVWFSDINNMHRIFRDKWMRIILVFWGFLRCLFYICYAKALTLLLGSKPESNPQSFSDIKYKSSDNLQIFKTILAFLVSFWPKHLYRYLHETKTFILFSRATLVRELNESLRKKINDLWENVLY